MTDAPRKPLAKSTGRAVAARAAAALDEAEERVLDAELEIMRAWAAIRRYRYLARRRRAA